MSMQLPGGLCHNQTVKRSFRFKPLCGALEFTIAELAEQGDPLPETISKILLAALAELADDEVSEGNVRALCVADRQFLMRQLQLYLGDRQKWYSTNCGHCHQPFDYELDLASLPVSEGGEDHPWVRVQLHHQWVTFRLPNGDDQYALANTPKSRAQSLLLQSCLQVEPDTVDAATFVAELTAAEISTVEQAMEAASPAIVTDIAVTCAHCEQVNPVYLDPYQLLNRGYGNLLKDIHTIASAYHWTEPDILALSSQRRATYLQMIDRDAGMFD